MSWCCWPRPDGDPMFCSLMSPQQARGIFSISLVDQADSASCLPAQHGHPGVGRARCARQCHEHHHLVPALFPPGTALSSPDADPAHRAGRRSAGGAHRTCGRPADYGARAFARQLGSHHVRFLDPTQSLRVTTDAPVSYLTEDRVFVLERPLDLVLARTRPWVAGP